MSFSDRLTIEKIADALTVGWVHLALTGKSATTRKKRRLRPAISFRPPLTLQSDLVEQLKLQEWTKSNALMVQDYEVAVWLVKETTKPITRRSYEADRSSEGGLVSGREMLADTLHKLFRSANDEVFEDGMDSRFSNSLIRIIRTHGIAAVDALDKMICMDSVNPEVAAEALVWVGRMDDEQTHQARLSMLERALESPNVCIRDGASIGIEAMDDPAAIGSLQKAIDREQCGLLRQNLKDTLEQLKDAR